MPATNNVTCLKFRDSSTGFAYQEYSIMLKTTDGGVSWTQTSIPMEISDIFWTSVDHAFGIGPYGLVSKTINGGLTWVATSTLPDQIYYCRSFFLITQQVLLPAWAEEYSKPRIAGIRGLFIRQLMRILLL